MVGRQDLAVGMGTSIATGANGGGFNSGDGGLGDGTTSRLPLSEEERDVRLAELMSFGVDLPNETLITLLRFVWWRVHVDRSFVACSCLSCMLIFSIACVILCGLLFVVPWRKYGCVA